jgi:uncharacterized membrane protein YeaQ/YmgE (transglycosylase-associated protein family)
MDQYTNKAESKLTFVAWTLIGVAAGLLDRLLMPVQRDGGNLAAICIGVFSACIGGVLATFFLGGSVIDLNSHSVGWALNAALYTLFAYRCLAMKRTNHPSWKPESEVQHAPRPGLGVPPSLAQVQVVTHEASE